MEIRPQSDRLQHLRAGLPRFRVGNTQGLQRGLYVVEHAQVRQQIMALEDEAYLPPDLYQFFRCCSAKLPLQRDETAAFHRP